MEFAHEHLEKLLSMMVFCVGGMAWNGNQGCTIYEIGGKLFVFFQ